MQKTERLPPPNIPPRISHTHTHIRKNKYRVKGTKNAVSATVSMSVCLSTLFFLFCIQYMRSA